MESPALSTSAAWRHQVFGHTVREFQCCKTVRRLSVVELWSGVGSVAAAARKRNLAAITLDREGSPSSTHFTEDLLTHHGFMEAVQLVLNIVTGGLLFMAPVCSSFTWLCSSQCKRTRENDHMGDLMYKPVQDGNLGADIAAFLFALAHTRGVEAAIENPSRSSMWKYPTVLHLHSQLPVELTITRRCAFDSKPAGQRYQKEYKILATGCWIKDVARPCKCPGGLHKPLAIRTGTQVTGLSVDLRASQAYPPRMGLAIVGAWARSGVRQIGSGVPQTTGSGVPGQSTHTSMKRKLSSQSESSDSPVRPVGMRRGQQRSSGSESRPRADDRATSSKRSRWVVDSESD